jgi:hypothetical protein
MAAGVTEGCRQRHIVDLYRFGETIILVDGSPCKERRAAAMAPRTPDSLYPCETSSTWDAASTDDTSIVSDTP